MLSAADRLNLAGILTPEARADQTSRLLLRDTLGLAALEGRALRRFAGS